ncbi:non-heme iron oxygenase ferredoxin subunit [Shinella sp. BYT-45]|uniref:non-heme iron oxygenase ferredoxin subunit n=1 Tax=Shinella sp. BYT-45 TaxID=3377377 RepID=UPI00397F49DF
MAETKDVEEETWVAVCEEAELAEHAMAAVTVGAHEIALYHLEGGEICATSNICTHGLAYLTEGWLTEEGLIECPLHAGCFDVRTGAGQGDPITEDLAVYPVRREGGCILVKVPGKPA